MIESARRRARAVFPLCAALALCPFSARAGSESGGAASPPGTTPIPEREIRDWRVLLERGDSYLARNAALLDSLAEEIPAAARELRNRMLGLEVRFFRLLALYEAHKKTPVFLYDIEEQIGAIERRVRVLAAPLERAQAALTAVEKLVPAGPVTEKMLGHEGPVEVPIPAEIAPMLADFKRRNGEICARAAALKGELSAPLHGAALFVARMEGLRKTAAEETGAALRDYYLEPRARLYGAEGWRQACGFTVLWFRNFAAIDLTFNQYDDRVWRVVLARALLAAVLLIAGGRALLGRLERRSGTTGLARALFPAAAWIAAGLALFIGVSLPSFTRSAFVVMMVWIFVSRGLISLGEALQALASPAPPPRPPWRIQPLWGAVAVGNILQSLDFRTEAITLLWAAALVLLWPALLGARGAGTVGRRALLWFFPGLIVCTVCGWANLAVFAATIVLVIRIGAALSAGIAAYRRRFQKNRDEDPRLAVRILRDLSSPPNVFVAVAIAGFAGYVIYLGGGPVLRLLLGMKITVRHVTLHLASVPLIVAGYFAARTAVSVACDVVRTVRADESDAREGEIISLQVLIRYIVWFVFAMLSLAALGFTTGNLALVAGGLSVGIGFGLQNIINNLVSGIILLLGREIQPGDMIERDGNFARVEQVTLRNTILRTYAGKTIIVPNSEFVTKSFSNWTYRDPRIRGNVTVRVPASADSREIEQLLLTIARAHENVLKFPVPSVRLENFAQGTVEFSLRVWVAHPRDWKVISDLRHDILRALKERGVAAA